MAVLRSLLPALVLVVGACSLILDFDDPLPGGDGGLADARPDGADVAEPNDSFAEATAIGGGMRFPLTVLPRGDQDFYRVTLPAGTNLVVTVRFTQSAGDLDLKLYDASMVEIARSAGNTDEERIERSAALSNQLPAGEYYVHVYGFDNLYTNTYSLEVVGP